MRRRPRALAEDRTQPRLAAVTDADALHFRCGAYGAAIGAVATLLEERLRVSPRARVSDVREPGPIAHLARLASLGCAVAVAVSAAGNDPNDIVVALVEVVPIGRLKRLVAARPVLLRVIRARARPDLHGGW